VSGDYKCNTISSSSTASSSFVIYKEERSLLIPKPKPHGECTSADGTSDLAEH